MSGHYLGAASPHIAAEDFLSPSADSVFASQIRHADAISRSRPKCLRYPAYEESGNR